jgi:diguanylate cyclase (GGDEF)-like protein/PAS domain S-box-containing protein
MSRTATYLVVGVIAVALYGAPGPLHASETLLALIGLTAVGVTVFAALRFKPAAAHGWWLLAAGAAVIFVGDLMPAGPDIGFPSLADAFYIATYPLLMAGLMVLVRRRSGSGTIDGLILTVGFALPSWIVLIVPYLAQDGIGLLDQLGHLAYPIGDMILLAAGAQLALDGGRRGASFCLLIASISLLLAADFADGVMGLHHVNAEVALNAVWGFAYVLWGGAVLHPSMRRLGEPVPSRDLLLTSSRLGLLTGAALVAPLLSAAHHVAGREFDFLVVDAASFTLFALVVTRMAGLARRQRALGEELHRRRGEERFAALVRHTSDLITVVTPGGEVTYSSPSVERILGADPAAAFTDSQDRYRIGEAITAVAAGREVASIECSFTDVNGELRRFEMRLTNLMDEPHVGGILLNSRDITERKAFEAELTHQAFHDPVTGLANRALFVERVRDAIARAKRLDGSLAVLFVDLDDFKTINDSLGHAAGDEVLVEVARRLDGGLRATDAAARFGGDEFAVLLEGAGSQAAADTAQRILDELAVPVQTAGRNVALRASLGISVALAPDTRSAEDLIRDADAAMYVAKRDGKGRYRLFEPAMHAGVLARLELRTDLQRAIAAGELELHYQPVVALSDGSTAGFEALMRWRHPERGLVSPLEFIPIAEETGLIVPMGRWALHEAAGHLRALGGDYRMNVNLSAKQLQDPGLVDDVAAAIAGLDPGRFVLELTESIVMEDTDHTVAQLDALKALGVRLALDDFGTGYSSLGYLSRLPVDVLKLDRSFLSSGSPELVRAVVGLGQALALDVVAEGIEERLQWEGLRALGCHYGQGFYFSRPLDAPASLAFLGART